MTSEELIKEVDRLVPKIMDAIVGEPAHIAVTTLTHVLREILTVHLKDAQIIQVLQDFQMGLVLGITTSPAELYKSLALEKDNEETKEKK